MKYSDFEKHIQQTFAEDEAAVDIKGLLDALNIDDASSRRPTHLPWFALCLGLLLAAGIGYLCLAPSSSHQTQSASPSPQPHTVDLANTTASNNDQTHENNSKYSQNTTDTDQPASRMAPANDNLTAAPQTDFATLEDQTSEGQLTQKTYADQAQSSSATSKSARTGTTSSELSLGSSKATKRDLAQSVSISEESRNYDVESRTRSYVATSVSNDSETESTSREATLSASRDLAAARTVSSGEAAETGVSEVARQAVAAARPLVELSPLLDYDRDMNPLAGKIECPSFASSNSWGIDLIPEIGYGLLTKTLEDLSPEQSSSVIALRNDIEKPLEALHAGLYVRLTRERWPFYIKTGIAHTRIAERSDLSYDYIERDTTQGIISITANPTGDTITTVIGDIVTETRHTGQSRRHYYLRHWDIPIGIGMERPVGSFLIGVEGGIHVNLQQSIEGNILNDASEFRTVEDYDINNRLGLGYFGGLSIGKHLRGIGDVYLSARARYIPNVSANSSVKHTYMTYGLHAGYVYRF